MNEPANVSTSETLPASSPSQGVNTFVLLLLALTVTAFSVFVSVWYMQTDTVVNASAQKLVFVNGNAIFQAQVKVFSESANAGLPNSAATEAKAFTIKMDAALAPYRQAGYIILNSAVAMNVPPELDITAVVAKQVGVAVPQ